MTPRLLLRGLFALLLSFAMSGQADAQQHGCAVQSVSTMDFGRPGANPTAAVPTTSDLVIECEGNGSERGATVQVCIGIEPDSARALRRLLLFPPPLGYQIYRDQTHTQVWGYNGARVSAPLVLSAGTNGRPSGIVSVRLHGLLVPGQNGLPAGTYVGLFNGDVRSSTNLSANCDTLPVRDTFNAFAVATLEGRCEVQVGDLSFGITSQLAADITSTSEMLVNCTAETAYRVRMSGGIVNSNVAARAMALEGTGPGLIAYELRHGGASGPLWGDGTAGTVTVDGTGTGNIQPITVHGRVFGNQAVPPAGFYKDVVTVTVEY